MSFNGNGREFIPGQDFKLSRSKLELFLESFDSCGDKVADQNGDDHFFELYRPYFSFLC